MRSAGLLLALCLASVAVAARADEAVKETPAPALPAPEKAACELHPNAGFANEAFFLRSDDDNFILLPSGRLQVDYFQLQHGGAKQPNDGFLPKRARIELGGSFLKRFDFWIGTELTGGTPAVTDAYVVGNFSRYAQVQVGQFDAPFTMENRTGDKYTDLQERSVVARGLGIPENKQVGAMVFGMPEKKWAYYSLGVFNGDGMQVFPHRSNAFDVIGRAWVAPFALAGNELLKNVWVGASGWNGFHAATPANQVDRIAMKDQSGFTFFNPANGAVHAGSSGQVQKWGLELNAPIGPFVFKSEYVRSSEGLREVDTANKNAEVRRASLNGSGFYARLSYFVWGDPLINGLGGMQTPNRLYEGALKPGKTESALQLMVEYDHVAFAYSALGNDAASDTAAGDYGLDVAAIGLNYWATKHLRFTANVLHNSFSGKSATPIAGQSGSWEGTLRAAVAL